MDAHNIKCICDLFNWEILLGRGEDLAFKPFSAIKSGADNGCHLCSLLNGALRVYHRPPGTTELKANCPCTIGNDALFSIEGHYNFIIIKVDCGGEEGERHLARLDLSKLPKQQFETPCEHVVFLLIKA